MKRLLAVGVVAAVWGSGCVVDVTFDPFGSDFSLQGEWTVNGVTPTAAECGPIDSIRVILWDEGTFYQYSDLTFPCAQGSFATGPIFAYGAYDTQWQALNAAGGVLAEGQRTELTVGTPSTSEVLQPVDFNVASASGDLSLNLQWTDKDTTLSDCTIGVSEMTYTLTDSGNEVVDAMGPIACGVALDYTDLPFDTYSLYIEGAMSSGRKDWMVTCSDIVHTVSGNAFNCPVTYVGP